MTKNVEYIETNELTTMHINYDKLGTFVTKETGAYDCYDKNDYFIGCVYSWEQASELIYKQYNYVPRDWEII